MVDFSIKLLLSTIVTKKAHLQPQEGYHFPIAPCRLKFSIGAKHKSWEQSNVMYLWFPLKKKTGNLKSRFITYRVKFAAFFKKLLVGNFSVINAMCGCMVLDTHPCICLKSWSPICEIKNVLCEIVFTIINPLPFKLFTLRCWLLLK